MVSELFGSKVDNDHIANTDLDRSTYTVRIRLATRWADKLDMAEYMDWLRSASIRPMVHISQSTKNDDRQKHMEQRVSLVELANGVSQHIHDGI